MSWRKKQSPTTKLKRKISRTTGIPLTKSGRKRKANRLINRNLVWLVFIALYFLFGKSPEDKKQQIIMPAETIVEKNREHEFETSSIHDSTVSSLSKTQNIEP